MVDRLKNLFAGSAVEQTYLTRDRARQVAERYQSRPVQSFGYATVEDYCDSIDHLPEITGRQGDLKDVQRPWAVKALIGLLPPGSTFLEIGAGLPDAAQVLTECGYNVIAVDPYEGAGNGPTEYERYRKLFPRVDIRKQLFDETLQLAKPVDAVYSISVLEHIHDLEPVFRAIRKVLKPGGISLHCIDVVVKGAGDDYHMGAARSLLRLQGEADSHAWDRLHEQANADVETYFLGPSGHQLWRSTTPYREFPFRRVLSLQTWSKFE